MKAVAVFDPNSSFNIYGISGFVLFEDLPSLAGTRVTFNLSNLPHRVDSKETLLGVHIHETGDLRFGCDGACSHFNPDGKRHGSYELHGGDHHAGDLINNILVSPSRTFSFSYIDPLISVRPSRNSILGRSVVIHSDKDDKGINRATDEESATTGNAGQRIACSVIGYAKEC